MNGNLVTSDVSIVVKSSGVNSALIPVYKYKYYYFNMTKIKIDICTVSSVFANRSKYSTFDSRMTDLSSCC